MGAHSSRWFNAILDSGVHATCIVLMGFLLYPEFVDGRPISLH